MGAGKKSLFFCQSRALSETVAERMRGRGIDVFVHHSSVALEERQAAEESFQSGANPYADERAMAAVEEWRADLGEARNMSFRK